MVVQKENLIIMIIELTILVVKNNKTEKEETIECDIVLSAVGVSPNTENIGLEALGIQTDRGLVLVDEYYKTNVAGIYAIGDVNIYPGKLKLILCGFHEATLMVQSAFKRIYPNKNLVLKYTTVNGIQGF